ncbi:hypothetical protein HY491_02385 [Candidatus Woesearchaeota archaeon]|nr:hypothetical protein [Candidatus Woesearchaeota archaeon]
MKTYTLLLLMLAAFLLATGMKLGMEWLSLHSERFATWVLIPYCFILLFSFLWLYLSDDSTWPETFQAMVVICLVISSAVHGAVALSQLSSFVLFCGAAIYAFLLAIAVEIDQLLGKKEDALFIYGGILFIALSSCISIRMFL